ncbi:MAG: LysR family transcriptional regulator [Sphingomonadaceae bacterium]|nr:LysR family transcriptional regulator [Sphingomonadaceae bacterium]
MRDPNWNDLRVFLAVAQAGQIGRAAARLNLDPTTLGRRIRRLEQQLEVTLFERTRVGQTLTEAGETLLLRTEAMAEAARQIDESLGGQSGLTGNLRLSVSEGFGSWFLSRHVSAFNHQYPRLTLDLVAQSGFLSPSRREADLAVMLSRPKSGPVIARKLSDYHLRLYASPSYLAAAGQPQEPQDLLTGHSLVGYIPDLLYAPELGYLDEIQPGLAANIRSSSINAQHRLLVHGAGIGVLPAFIAAADERLVPILPDKQITRSFWLVTHRDTQNLARVRAGRDWLLDCVQQGRERLLGPW